VVVVVQGRVQRMSRLIEGCLDTSGVDVCTFKRLFVCWNRDIVTDRRVAMIHI